MNWRTGFFSARIFVPLLILALPVPVLSLLVRPILLDMKASGSGTNSSFEVVNDRNRPITVEVAVQSLAIPERGNVVLSPNDGADFQIFPPIASIPAGKKQVFRVKWIGAPNIEQSQLYMFSSSELPVKREVDAASSVQVLYAINSVVAVAPADKQASISVERVERAVSKDGKPGVEVTFVNGGGAHGYVAKSGIDLSIAGSDWKATLNEGVIGQAFGLGLVPPNAKRVMFAPLEGVPVAGDIAAVYRQAPGNKRRAL